MTEQNSNWADGATGFSSIPFVPCQVHETIEMVKVTF